MKRIITATVKELKERGRHPNNNMALLSLFRFRINRIMLSASAGLQFFDPLQTHKYHTHTLTQLA